MDIYQKLAEIEDFRLRQELEEQLRELVLKHPEVRQTGIPQEALDRFRRGGVTLTEAYRLARPTPQRAYSGDDEEREALRALGMTPEEAQAYRRKLEAARKEQAINLKHFKL